MCKTVCKRLNTSDLTKTMKTCVICYSVAEWTTHTSCDVEHETSFPSRQSCSRQQWERTFQTSNDHQGCARAMIRYWSGLTSALTPPRCVSWRHQHCLLFMRLLTTYIQQDTFLITETPCLATCVNGFLHDCFHAQVNCPCFIRWDCVMYGSLWFRLFSVVVKIVWDCSNLDVIGSSALLRVFFVCPCSGRKQMELNWDSRRISWN